MNVLVKDKRPKIMKKRAQLPKTSRVNDKIIEYWQKFGRERDLDKYMRLYSPSSGSQRSVSGANSSCATPPATTASTTSITSNATDSSDGRALRQLFKQTDEEQPITRTATKRQKKPKHNSKSRAKLHDVKYFTSMEVDVHCAHEVIIPIQLDEPKVSRSAVESMTSINNGVSCTSVEELYTPPRQTKDAATTTTTLQTPDSIVKSHKRLEWDSLGDVGYKKSSSTSNISSLERTLLKEFFLESALNEQRNKTKTNSSESDLKRLQIERNTPPLASSTFVDAATKKKTIADTRDAHRDSVNASNCTRPQRQLISQASQTVTKCVHDQSAQTSSRQQSTRPEMATHSVQATLTTNSYMGSSATPSSFEYFSSHSSTTSNAAIGHAQRKQQRAQSQPDPHVYIAHVNKMLAHQQRQSMQQQEQTQQTSDGNLINENKENMAISNKASMTKSDGGSDSIRATRVIETHAPELDLGIQLLCSLVDAKSLNNSQKKQFIRDIAKKISYVGGISSTNTSSSASMVRRGRHKYASSSAQQSESKRSEIADGLGGGGGDGDVLQTQTATEYTISENNDNERRQSVQNQTDANAASAADAISMTSINPKSSASSTRNTTAENSRSSTASKELLTQKLNAAMDAPVQVLVVEDANSDLEQATMREWLNPMTQSEIEYEEKRRNMPKLPSRGDYKVRKQYNSHRKLRNQPINTESAEDTERRSQLHWVESEINRLEGLRQLLKKIALSLPSDDDPSQISSSSLATAMETTPQVSSNTEPPESSRTGQPLDKVNEHTQAEPRIYDSVNSEQEIEIVIEKTKERKCPDQRADVAKNDLHWLPVQTTAKPPHKPKRPTEQNKPITIAMATATKPQSLIAASGDPRSGGQHEKIITPTLPTAPTAERSKMPTPSTSNSNSTTSPGNAGADGGCSESVCSFVQQRKREFMEHYNAKRLQQQELLKKHEEQKRKRQEKQTSKEQQRRLKQHGKQQQQQHQQHQQHQHLQQPMRQLIPPPPCHLYRPPQYYSHHHYHQAHLCAYHAHSQQTSEQQMRQCACARAPLAEHQHYYQVVPPATVLYAKNCAPTTVATSSCTANAADTCLPTSDTASVEGDDKAKQNAEYVHQENTTRSTTTTTSSLFCMTSDVSVPMGGASSSMGRHDVVGRCVGGGITTSSSTTTTTHQYDDVAAAAAAAGIGVQTGGSMRRMQPIYATAATRSASDHLALGADQRQTTACVQVRPRGIAYVIEFPQRKASSSDGNGGDSGVGGGGGGGVVCGCDCADVNALGERATGGASGVTTVAHVVDMQALTLQDHLQRAKPKFCAQSKERKSILNAMQLLRNERRRELDDIVENTSYSSLDRKLNQLPPAPTSNVRIFSTREMKAMTNRRCEVLPEVLERQKREREERRRHSNRMLRDVFNRRLQRRVRSGKISMNHSRTLI